MNLETTQFPLWVEAVWKRYSNRNLQQIYLISEISIC